MNLPMQSRYLPAHAVLCSGLLALAWAGCASDELPTEEPNVTDTQADRSPTFDEPRDSDEADEAQEAVNDHAASSPSEPLLPAIDANAPTLAMMRVASLVWQPQPANPLSGLVNSELQSAIAARTINIIFKHLPSAEADGAGRLDLHGSGTCATPQHCEPGPRTAAMTIAQPPDNGRQCDLSVVQLPELARWTPQAPCVRSSVTDVELVLGTLGVVPLESVEIVASQQNSQLPRGLLVGFLRESVAVNLPTRVPFFATVASVLGNAGRTTHEGQRGWWLPLTFTSAPL